MNDLSQADLTACWSCGGPMSVSAAFCPTCHVVQPPRQHDHFERLGLTREFTQLAEGIDTNNFVRQRQLHPDRFASRSSRERAVAQLQAAALNEAYETLKDPLRRATYLAGLRGVELPTDGRTIADPDLLMEAMEAREALQEAGDVPSVDRLALEAAAKLRSGLDALNGLFLQGDPAAIRKALLRLRYIEKFADEARARRLNLGAATR